MRLNRQARDDGTLVSIDSKSLHHEAKAAGVIYQAVVRHELHEAIGAEWNAVDGHSAMAEIAGVTKNCLTAWSRRSTRLREWARNNLVVVDGELSAQQLAAAQKATRPAKPESKAWAELKGEWRADARGLDLDRGAHLEARAARRAAPRLLLDRARLARMVARIDKPACTCPDLVELVGALLPVDAPGDARALIEQIVDMVGVRVSAPREAHHREGHEMFTVDAVIAKEQRVFDMIDAADARARLDVRAADLDDLSADQARAIANIAASPYLVQPLQAPAGAGKTHSLQALRAAAHRTNKDVLVLAPTGKAVDEAMRDGAGDRGLTVAKALKLIEDNQLQVDRRTVIVVDEASMVATPELRRLLEASTAAHAKIVLVGDAYQLAPVKARGGMFENLCDDLPWSQRLSEVWRMRNTAERDASLALRSAQGNRLRKAVGWYRNHDRLHIGDAIAMAADATAAYITARAEGKDVAILCDTWEIADAVNQRLHRHPKTVRNCRRSAMLDLAFVALLVGLAALAVGFAAACDRLLGPDEPVLSEAAVATHRKCPISTSEPTRIVTCCATLGQRAPHGHQENAPASRGRAAYRNESSIALRSRRQIVVSGGEGTVQQLAMSSARDTPSCSANLSRLAICSSSR